MIYLRIIRIFNDIIRIIDFFQYSYFTKNQWSNTFVFVPSGQEGQGWSRLGFKYASSMAPAEPIGGTTDIYDWEGGTK